MALPSRWRRRSALIAGLAAALVATAGTIAASRADSQVGTCRATAAEGTSTDVLITGVTLIPMDIQRERAARSVLIRNGIIERIDPGAIGAPTATRIDGRGCFLIPGLIDMHVHLYDSEGFPSYLRYGVTTVANLNGNQRILALRDSVAHGRLLGPSIVTASPSMDGAPALNPAFISVNDPIVARAAVRAQQAAGYDFIKVYSGLRPEVYRAIIAEGRARNFAVVGHAPIRVGIDSVLVSGQANVAHIEEFFQNPVDDSHFPALVAAAKRSGITVTPNIVAYSDYLRSIADLNGTLVEPEMRFASPAAFGEKLPANNRSVRPNPAGFAAALKSQQARFRVLTKMLSDAGVPLFDGTDTEIFGQAGSSAQAELRELHASGLTPYQALRAATAAPGDFLDRILHQHLLRGRIVAGATADLVLLNANPLHNIANADSVRGVVVRGRWLSRPQLDRTRDSVATADAPVRAATVQFDSLVSLGQFDRAVAVIRQSQARSPGIPTLAEILIPRYASRALRAQQPAAAVSVARLGPLLYPNSSTAYRELARVELATGDTTAARRHLAEALRLQPYHVWASETAARLKR